MALMPGSIFSTPPRIPPSSRSLSLFIPSSLPDYPLLHQGSAGQEHDFAPNASLTPSRRIYVRTTPEQDLQPVHLCNNHSGIRDTPRDKKNLVVMSPNGNQRILKRLQTGSRRLRIFHNEPFNSFASPTKGSKIPFELPPPMSPTRRRLRPKRWSTKFANLCRSRLFAHPMTYLALYFTLNLCLTLYNKSLLINFPFPYTLSALHSLCGSIGSFILVRAEPKPVPRLNMHETIVLIAFSSLYTINIIVSNVSLSLVTVPFHQVIRASTPLFTILFSITILGARSSRAKLLSLLPVVAGVGFATYGDYYFTLWGFFLTLIGTVLASLKTIYTNVLQVPVSNPPLLKTQLSKHDRPLASARYATSDLPTRWTRLPPLSPLHFLHLLSPLAFFQTTLLAYFAGELDRVQAHMSFGTQYPQRTPFTGAQLSPMTVRSSLYFILLLINGVMAFGLNVVSFSANRKVGALGMTVAANVKQVLTILCAVMLFNLTITPLNALGIVLTLVGGAVYAAVELKERQKKLPIRS